MRDRCADKRTRNVAPAVFCALWLAIGAAFPAGAAAQPDPDLQTEEVEITLPGVTGEYSILWVSDMHICCFPEDGDVLPEHSEQAGERAELLRNADGVPSARRWEQISAGIDAFGADYVVFGADMIDYASEANLDALSAGLAGVNTPWMYIRADHDYGRWYVDMGIRKMRSLHREIAPQEKMWVQRFDGFTLVGLDNTTSAVTQETLDAFREICAEGVPVLLCTHVPFDQPEEADRSAPDSLAALSRECWGDRVLCWGKEDYYDTEKSSVMEQMADLIYEEDSPVRAVFAGHLHASWEGSLTPACMEHVFSAAFEDHIGLITVRGE